MQRIISGIQQIGIGVANAAEAYQWYKNTFGFDVVVFEDKAPAALMTQYTGGEVHHRYAVLAMNMQGGAGFEIWQYTSRRPQAAPQPHALGDTGIFAVKIRCRDVEKAYGDFSRQKVRLMTPVTTNPAGQLHFYVQDPYNNIFEITEDAYWFSKNKSLTGGICGAAIGVTDMNAALCFYRDVLGYSIIGFNGETVFDDLTGLPGAEEKIRRVVLKQAHPFCGAFSRLLGPSTIELIEAKERKPIKIFAGRYWGDLGFIHICYDVCGINHHAALCQAAGRPLTVNSGASFAMGKAAGHFAYNEDPDGTLIEYVETHKVPILKKLGWYLDLRKRNTHKPLPNWMVRCMGLGKKSLQLSS